LLSIYLTKTLYPEHLIMYKTTNNRMDTWQKIPTWTIHAFIVARRRLSSETYKLRAL
jgi:hypothetical protein